MSFSKKFCNKSPFNKKKVKIKKGDEESGKEAKATYTSMYGRIGLTDPPPGATPLFKKNTTYTN